MTFREIAERFLRMKGYEPYVCETEKEAREKVNCLSQKRKWPCLFTVTDTTGEKEFEEFYDKNDKIDWNKFKGIGVIKNAPFFEKDKLEYFIGRINEMRERLYWDKKEIVELFEFMLPEFRHVEKGKYLDDKM